MERQSRRGDESRAVPLRRLAAAAPRPPSPLGAFSTPTARPRAHPLFGVAVRTPLAPMEIEREAREEADRREREENSELPSPRRVAVVGAVVRTHRHVARHVRGAAVIGATEPPRTQAR